MTMRSFSQEKPSQEWTQKLAFILSIRRELQNRHVYGKNPKDARNLTELSRYYAKRFGKFYNSGHLLESWGG